MSIKLTAVLITVTLLQASAATYAQKVSYSNKHASLEQIFKEIRKQTGYNILVAFDALSQSPEQAVNFNQTPLAQVLEQCLQATTLTYEIDNKDILIKEKTVSVLEKIKAMLTPPYVIKGRVTDDSGRPLAGATVVLKGYRIAVVTEQQGMFTLTANIPDKQLSHLTLQVTYIGYEPADIRVDEKLDIQTIRLKPGNSKLDQVQIQAYGQTSKRLNTGDIGTVKAADIAKQPVTNVLEAIEGRIPGVFVTQASGLPNSTVNVQIRGTNTIAQSTSPLYVIDGLPYTGSMLLNAGTSGSGQASPLAFLNPSSIESIDVLKDADATAIYGSRGANGVILITTKKGTAGTMLIDANVYAGSSSIPRKVNLMNTDEYLTMRREALKNDGTTATAANAPDLLTWDQNRYTDWPKRLLGQRTLTTDAQVSISGGTGTTQYRIYGGYDRSEPPFPGDFKNSKTSAGITLSTASVNKRFRAEFGANYLADYTYLPQYDPTTNISIAPNAPEPINADGSLNYVDYRSGNPFVGFKNWYKGNTNNLVSNITLSYEFIPSLIFKVTGGYNISTVNGLGVTTIASNAGNPSVTNPTGTSNFAYNKISSWIAEPQLTYGWNLLKGKWNALIGTTFQQSNTSGQIITGSGYSNDALLNSLAAAITISKGTSTEEQSKFTSVYGRLNYNYDDKYLLNLTGRRDGSSRFGPDKRFGNFGAAGIGWIFSKENIVSKNLPLLSFGKLRASYGITGNEPSGNYKFASLNTFLSPTRPYQNTAAISTDNLLSPDYAWEEVRKLEGGIELGFLKDRVLASASYFRNRSSNQLVNYTVPSITGYSSVLLNRDATVQNTGFEITLSTVNVISAGFTWKSDFNITISRNKLLAFPDLANTPYNGSLVVGLPLSVQARYRAAGVDPQTGIYQFYTQSGGLSFNPDYTDATDFTSFDPKFFGGFQNSFTYQRISLDVFFQFVSQKGNNPIFNISTTAGQFYNGNGNQVKELLNRWQKPGDIATYQKYSASFGDAYNAMFYQQQSTAAITDASYIRLKNVSLSYDIPVNIIHTLKLQKARFYFQAQNLLTISKFPGLDPESQTYLPPLSIWTVGAQITF